MNRNEIIEKVQEIFRDIFDNDDIVLTDTLSANEIKDWDSLAQIRLLEAIESNFEIRFKNADVAGLKNVGEMIDLIESLLHNEIREESEENKYDELYEIRCAHIGEVDEIMSFISKQWRPDHLFAQNRDFFEYVFVNDDKVQFVVAVHRERNKIEAVLGYIYSSHTKGKDDIWPCFWAAERISSTPLLGVEIFRRLKDLTGCRNVLIIGEVPKTSGQIFSNVFQQHEVRLNRYYLLNTKIKEYHVAKIENVSSTISEIADGSMHRQSTMILFKTIEELKSKFNTEEIDTIPYKDNWYLNYRYFEFPWFKYLVFGIPNDEEAIKAVAVFRIVGNSEGQALQLVDYVGNQDVFLFVESHLKKWMIEDEFEFIDFLAYGFDEKILDRMGFIKQTDDDKNLIPDYFEPFQMKSDPVWAAFSDGVQPLFFKADGDQNMPRINRGKI